MNTPDEILSGHYIGSDADKDWPALNRADCKVLQLKVIFKDLSQVDKTTDYGLMLTHLLTPVLLAEGLSGLINPLSWSPDSGMGRGVLIWIWKKGADSLLHSVSDDQVERVLGCLKESPDIEGFHAREKTTTERFNEHTLTAEHHYTRSEIA